MHNDQNNLNGSGLPQELDSSLEYSQSSATPASRLTQSAMTAAPAAHNPPSKRLRFKFGKHSSIFSVSLILLGLMLLIGGGGLLFANHSNKPAPTSSQKIANYANKSLPIESLDSMTGLQIGSADKLAVNGQLQVSNSLVLSPEKTPSNPVAGQFYFDQTTKIPYYYNGSQFVSLGQAATTVVSNSKSSGVISVQGQNGVVNFSSGGGLIINGTEITNSGVTSLSGRNGLTVSTATGDIVIGLPQALDAKASPAFSGLTLSGLGENGVLYGGGSSPISSTSTSTSGLCLVSTSGAPGWSPCSSATISGTAGDITMFTADDQIGDSLLSQSGSTITVNGDLTVTGTLSGNGSGLTNLNASNVSAGVLPIAFGGTGATDSADARTNLEAAQSGINGDITSLTALSSITPSTSLTIGAASQPLTLQGSASSIFSATNNGFTTTLSFAQPSATANIVLPNSSGTVAVQATGPLQLDQNGNISCPDCLVDNSGGGSGGVSGVVSVNSFSGDVSILQGTGLTITNNSGAITVGADQDIATSASPTFASLSLNGSLGVGTSSPQYPIDVNGDVNVSGSYRINGQTICTSGGCAVGSGSGNYIQNGTTLQTAAFAVQGSATASTVGLIRGANGQTANIFAVQTNAGSNILAVAPNGRIGIANGSPNYPLDVNGDINTNGAFRINGAAVCSDSSGCTPAPGSNNYIQNGTTLQGNANFAFQSAAAGDIGGVVRGATSQTADLFEAQNSSAVAVFSVGANGQGYFAGNVGIGTTPAYPLDVAGDVNISSASDYRIAGADICDNTGCVSRGGSGSYIQNGTVVQTATYAIQSGNAANVVALIRGATGQAANLLDLQNNSGTNVASVNASGTEYLANALGVGVASPSYAVDVSGDVNITGAYRINGVAVCSASGCAAAGGSGSYIQNGTAVQSANFAISSAASSTSPTAVIKQAASQTGDLLDLEASGGSIVAAFNTTGQLRVGGATAFTDNLNIGTNTTTAAGGIGFGSDTDLYRAANATLKTDGTLQAAALVEMAADNSTGLLLQSSTASSTKSTNLTFRDNQTTPQSISLAKSGNNLVVLDNSGAVQLGFSPTNDAILFGNALDTDLYRSGSNALKTDGSLTTVGLLTATGGELVGGTGSTDSTTTFDVQNAAGSNVLVADTTDRRVGIDTTSPPNYTLDVNGDVNVASGSVYRIGGMAICTSSGCTPASGSGYYIQNGTALQNANFYIQNNSSDTTPTAVIKQTGTQTSDLLDFQNSGSAVVASFNGSGQENLAGATSYVGALTLGNTSSTTAASGISFGSDTNLYRSAAGVLSLQSPGTSTTLQAAAATGIDTNGTNLKLAGGIGTGAGTGGNISFQISSPAAANQSFISAAGSGPTSTSVNSSKIYWAINGTGNVASANLDGTGVNTSFITGGSGTQATAIDGSYIYWANSLTGTIGRANLDGTGVNQNFITGANNPRGLAVNGLYIYWGNTSGNTIGRANLDGTGVNQNFITGLTNVYGPAVNNSFIYWGNNSGSPTIGRANLDGSGVNTNFMTGVTSVTGVTVDTNYIYWSNTTTNTIGRANLDGSSPNVNFITGANIPRGLAVTSSFIYWVNNGNATIGRTAVGTSTSNTLSTVASFSGNNGAVLFQNATNSTTAFQIQNAAGTSLLTADTVNSALTVNGTATFKNQANSTTAFQIQNAAGTALLTDDTTTGNLTVSQGNINVSGAMAAPASATLSTAATGGSLAANRYFYAVAATNAAGMTNATYPTPSFVTTTGSTSLNTLTWAAVSGATGYKVYRSLISNNTWTVTNVSSSTTSINDDGTTYSWATSGNPSYANTTGGGTVNAVNSYQLNGANVLQEPSYYSLFVGTGAGNSSTAAIYSTAVGFNALASVTAGVNNTALGTDALQVNSTGSANTAIGTFALQNSTGGSNTVIGYGAFRAGSSGANNVALGTYAGITNNSANETTTGSGNTFLGTLSGAGTSIQLQNATAVGIDSVVNANNTLTLGCLNGVNGCTATTNVGINSGGYSNNPLQVSGTTYSTGTIAQTTTTITGTGTTFTSGMTGGTIYYSDGTTATVTYVSATSLTSSVSKTVTAGSTYTIVYGGFNVTSTGTAYLQPTTNSTTAFQVQNASDTQVLTVDSTNSKLTVQGSQSTATLGSELTNGDYTNAAWTSPGWTTTTTTATHNTGNTSALSSSVSVISGQTYQVSFTTSGSTAGSVGVSLGALPIYNYGATNGYSGNSTYSRTVVANSTGSVTLSFTPTTDFNGTLSAISLKQITLSTVLPVLAINNSDGTTGLEVRSGGSGLSDTFIGLNSGKSNTNGSSDTALGANALQANTTGYSDTAIGANALQANTLGYSNTALGTAALFANTTGGANTAIGASALVGNTSGTYNTAVGSNALQTNSSGYYNTAVGYFALRVSIGNSNSAFGYYALQSTTSGTSNTANGTNSLVNNTTGSNNTALGNQAGYTNTPANATTTGSGNTFLGTSSGAGTPIQLQNATTIGIDAVVNASNTLTLGCLNGVNGCTATTNVGINSGGYANNSLQVSGTTYSTGTIAQTTTAITGSGTTFTSGMTGATIYYPDGTSATVTYVDATHLTSSLSKTVTAGSTYTVVYGGFNVTTTGTATLQPTADSTTTFQIQNAAATTTLLDADTTNGRVGIGAAPGTALLTVGTNTTAATSGIIFGTDTGAELFRGGAGLIESSGVLYGVLGLATSSYLQLNTASTSAGYIIKTSIAGTGGVTNHDVVVMNSSGQVVDTTTTGDTRVYGVSATTQSTTGLGVSVVIAGNYAVNADATTKPINVGDQLVTSTTSGAVMADNSATTGIVGTALSSLASGTGTVNIAVNVVHGQYAPRFQNATNSTTAFQIQNSAGTALLTADTANMVLTVQSLVINVDLTVNGHYISGGTTPTAVIGAAAGSGATVSVNGDDTLGTVTITTGSSPSSAGVLATITFSKAFGNAPRVVLSPSNAAASGSLFYKGASNTTTFQIDVNAIPYGATTYTFDYFAGQ